MDNKNNPQKKEQFRIFSLILGPLLLVLSRIALSGVFSAEESTAIGICLWMMAWFITGPVALAVTAMVPVAVNAVIPIVPMNSIIAQFSSETIVLLFAANLLTLPWGNTGLDRRLALGSLRLVGTSVKFQMFAWFLLSAVFSAVLPNTVVVTIFTPVAVAMLAFLGHNDIATSKAAAPILLAVTYGCAIGGGLTPLGGAMNVIAIDLIQQHTGVEFMYIDWMTHMVPMILVIGAILFGAMLLYPLEIKTLEGTKEYFKEQYAALGKMKKGEKLSAGLFVVALLASFLRPMYSSALPGLTPAYAMLLLAMITFMIKDENGNLLTTWPKAEKSIMWNMLFLIAGGGIIGSLLTQTGAANTIAGHISSMNLTGGLMTVFIFVAFTYIVAECSSQTAAAAVAIPVVISVTETLGILPTPYLFICCMAFSGSYLLPLGVRAVPMGYGLPVNEILKRGTMMFVVNLIAVTLVGYLFMEFVPSFSVLPGF